MPGPVDFQAGVPVSPPIMPGWDGYPVRDALSREFGTPVLLDNDVNVMALGEQHNGVARSASDFLFVKIGTGIGCGIVVRRSPLPRRRRLRRRHRPHPARARTGRSAPAATTGCLEAFFGGAALARDATAAARSGRSAVLAELLEERRRAHGRDVGLAPIAQGDAVALQLARDGGRRVGSVLANLVSFFNPGLIVIGGGVAGLGHSLLAEIRSVDLPPVAARSPPATCRSCSASSAATPASSARPG